MEYQFYLTKEAVEEMETIDYEAFERAMDGDVKLYRLRPAIARFMVDKDNKPIPYNQALKFSEHLKVKECNEFVRKFFDSMSEKAVPKANGSELKSQSEAITADSLSLPG